MLKINCKCFLRIDAGLKQLKTILSLARLHFLIPGFMLFLLGYLLAILGGIEYDLIKFVFGYLVFGSAHLSVSFSNDYFDRHSDRNSVKTAFSGGSKVLIKNPELESFALRFAIFLLCFSAIINIFITFVYGYSFWFFVFGILGGLLGFFYTAPPLKLAYRGLGELSTMLAVGIFMPGMGYFVASGTLDSIFSLLILPLSCYGLFFILTVHLPDVESDTLAQKKNILVKLGTNSGKLVTVVATISGTFSLMMLLFFNISDGIIDWSPFVAFSILPLLASISSYLWRTMNRKYLVRQVMINMASMILFLLLMDMSLLFQNIW